MEQFLGAFLLKQNIYIMLTKLENIKKENICIETRAEYDIIVNRILDKGEH